MTVKECYDQMGGNYNEVSHRFLDDNRILKFLSMFLRDDSFMQLKDALQSGNLSQAFMAAHTLKGITMNLSLERLAKVCVDITEKLRPQQPDATIMPLWLKLEQTYNQTVDTLNVLLTEGSTGGGNQ